MWQGELLQARQHILKTVLSFWLMNFSSIYSYEHTKLPWAGSRNQSILFHVVSRDSSERGPSQLYLGMPGSESTACNSCKGLSCVPGIFSQGQDVLHLLLRLLGYPHAGSSHCKHFVELKGFASISLCLALGVTAREHNITIISTTLL